MQDFFHPQYDDLCFDDISTTTLTDGCENYNYEHWTCSSSWWRFIFCWAMIGEGKTDDDDDDDGDDDDDDG